VARLRISLPATSDYWVNDSAGDPLFVVTAEANAGLVKMLPGILDQVRALVGKRRVTVVFDRGGYSPKLFLQMLADDFDLLTYRKGRYPRIPRQRFQERRTRRDGRTLTYVLADQEVHACHRGALRGTQPDKNPLSRFALALALCDSGGILRQKADILDAAMSGAVESDLLSRIPPGEASGHLAARTCRIPCCHSKLRKQDVNGEQS